MSSCSLKNIRHTNMSSTSKLEIDVEIKSPTDKFWGILKDSVTLFPKILPKQYKSIEVLEGDGKGVGTVKLVKYAEGVPLSTFSKERIDEFDDASKMMAYSVIDGELTRFYKDFKAKFYVTPKGEGESLVKWSCEFTNSSGEAVDPTFLQGYVTKSFHDVDAYLLSV